MNRRRDGADARPRRRRRVRSPQVQDLGGQASYLVSKDDDDEPELIEPPSKKTKTKDDDDDDNEPEYLKTKNAPPPPPKSPPAPGAPTPAPASPPPANKGVVDGPGFAQADKKKGGKKVWYEDGRKVYEETEHEAGKDFASGKTGNAK